MTAKELISRMPEAFKPEAAANTDATVQYDISEPMYTVIKDGTITVHEGTAPKADVTIKMKDDDLVKLLTGELNGMAAFMSGKLKIQGDMMLAQRLNSFFDQNKAKNA